MKKHVIPRLLKLNVPDVATKLLKFRVVGGKRIMTVSSNWLPLFGFHSDARVVEESLGDGNGYQVRLATEDDSETKKVYLREYTSRSSNPLKKDAKRIEQLIETSSKKIINKSMGDATHSHITFRHGVITFSPVKNAEYKLLQDMSDDDMINTLVAMTGGVDCAILEQGGFRVDTVVEYRPQERRDKTDYTELTSLSVLANCSPRVLCNEDIYSLNMNKLAELIGDTPITVAHVSLQCDDFTAVKNKADKKGSLTDLSSTIDMFIPTLNMLDAVKPPVLVVENVQGFMGSKDNPNPINDVFCLQLRRRGYNVHQDVFTATSHDGLTTRKRMYLVATTIDAPFSFPEKKENARSVWDEVILPHWDEIKENDITELKVMQDAIKTGRARVINEDKQFSPTLMKAQGQDTKDSVVIERDGRFYRVPLSVQKKLNCLPDSFDADWMPKDKAAQIIGQSICGSLHHAIMQSVKQHIKSAIKRLTEPKQLSLAL